MEMVEDIIDDISDPALRSYVEKKFNEEFYPGLGRTVVDIVFGQINGRVSFAPVGYHDNYECDGSPFSSEFIPATTLIRARKALIEVAAEYKYEYHRREREFLTGDDPCFFKK